MKNEEKITEPQRLGGYIKSINTSIMGVPKEKREKDSKVVILRNGGPKLPTLNGEH